MSYLDQETQIDVLGLRLRSVDLAVLFVANVDTLKDGKKRVTRLAQIPANGPQGASKSIKQNRDVFLPSSRRQKERPRGKWKINKFSGRGAKRRKYSNALSKYVCYAKVTQEKGWKHSEKQKGLHSRIRVVSMLTLHVKHWETTWPIRRSRFDVENLSLQKRKSCHFEKCAHLCVTSSTCEAIFPAGGVVSRVLCKNNLDQNFFTFEVS